MMYTSGGAGRHDYSGAVIRVSEDGTATVMVGAPDVGQGSRTTLAQIAAQELGIRYEDVWIDQPDTDVSPADLFGANAPGSPISPERGKSGCRRRQAADLAGGV